jgi:hypothetical protein
MGRHGKASKSGEREVTVFDSFRDPVPSATFPLSEPSSFNFNSHSSFTPAKFNTHDNFNPSRENNGNINTGSNAGAPGNFGLNYG